jgi:hypothetical protein
MRFFSFPYLTVLVFISPQSFLKKKREFFFFLIFLILVFLKLTSFKDFNFLTPLFFLSSSPAGVPGGTR